MPCPLFLELDQALNRSFRTTLLLTGNVLLAEAALLHAISATQPEDILGESLLDQIVISVIALSARSMPAENEDDDSSLLLPHELQQVLRLPADLRHCFVLRILVGFSRERCARLLNVTIQEIDERATAAAIQLALLSEDHNGATNGKFQRTER
jgi:hypothetical protein